MNDRSHRLVSRLRIFVPLAVLVLILAGASAAFASGAFESNDSRFDSPRDVVERGVVDASTTTTTLPEAHDANDDHGVDASPAPQAQDEDRTVASNDGRDDNSGPGNVSDDTHAEDNSGHDSSNSGHGSSRHSGDD